MLPLIVDEAKVFTFKFWYNGNIQEGMCHRNELFCRIQTFNAKLRAQVYHLGCKLTQSNNLVVLTSSSETCSLWVSLRAPELENLLEQADSLDLPYPDFSSLDLFFSSHPEFREGEETGPD